MGELLWTCEPGNLFRSELNGLRVTVVRTGAAGYRYQLMGPLGGEREMPLASGHREELRDAMDAAERAAHSYLPPVEDRLSSAA